MDITRAKEILNSLDTYEVFYNGKLVWINNVDTENNVADVEILGEGKIIKVPVIELREGEKVEKRLT